MGALGGPSNPVVTRGSLPPLQREAPSVSLDEPIVRRTPYVPAPGLPEGTSFGWEGRPGGAGDDSRNQSRTHMLLGGRPVPQAPNLTPQGGGSFGWDGGGTPYVPPQQQTQRPLSQQEQDYINAVSRRPQPQQPVGPVRY